MSNACGRRGEYHSDHRDGYTPCRHTTLHASTCTRSRVITYILDLSSWIHGAMHVEEGESTTVITEMATPRAGTCTRSRVITYLLDSSSRIHGAMHVEEGESTTVIIEMATLRVGTCTRSRVITYSLDSSSWIHGAMHVEETVETLIPHAGICTSTTVQ